MVESRGSSRTAASRGINTYEGMGITRVLPYGMDLSEKKQLFRTVIKVIRKLMNSSYAQKASLQIAEVLLERPEVTENSTICMYFSLPEEVDTMPILAALLTMGKTVVFPKVVGKTLTLHRVRSIREVTRGAYNILEPKKSCRKYPVSVVDCFIVPGVAFDRKGFRLGRGVGYYDRLLSATQVPKIGLAFNFQVIAEVPHTSYDVPMTVVITQDDSFTIA